jgi:2-keto-3-deoxy-L-rhamnonate aldolase RhmA
VFLPHNHLKQKLARGETTLGMWITLEAPSISEIAVMLGMDWIVIDTEHGHLDYKDVVEHIRVTRNTTTTPIVRIQEIEQGSIKRYLDLGAHGIIVPHVYAAKEVEQAVRFAKYPPWGVRGVGSERALQWGLGIPSQTRIANDEGLVIPLLETVPAGEAIDAILDVRGVDAIFFGPADYSASAGYLGEWEGPGVADRILDLKKTINARGIPCGIMAKSIENALLRRQQGFQMIGIGSDTGLLIRSTMDVLKALGRSAPVL